MTPTFHFIIVISIHESLVGKGFINCNDAKRLKFQIISFFHSICIVMMKILKYAYIKNNADVPT